MAETAAVIVAAAGVGLLYAAVTNQNPLTELRSALSTGSTSGATPIRVAPVGAQSSYAGEAARNDPSQTSTSTGAPATLQTIGQGSHRLAAPAAQAFARFQQAFGAAIPITDSYRDYATAARNYAADPARFANPANSRHVRGMAIDVNLQALGARPTGGNPSTWNRDPVYARLLAAARSTGWCNYQVHNGSTGSKIAEPWHFSFGDCG